MAKRHFISEKFITSTSKPEDLLWVNGTTDKRFDIAQNKFRDVSSGDLAKLSPFTPMYLTSNINYALSYVKSHASKDFGIKNPKLKAHREVVNSHGLVVFVQLKDGVHLFDFTDKSDYAAVFSEDAGEIFEIFREAEPYFSFNTSVANSIMNYVPIEFYVAREMSVWLGNDKKFTSDAKKRSFINLFKIASSDAFNFKVSADLYSEFMQTRNEWLDDADMRVSKTGRKQIYKGSQFIKDLPEQLDNQQFRKVNAYLSLFKQCIEVRKWLFSDRDILPQRSLDAILSMNDPKQRAHAGGYVDLLQACLYFMIYTSSDFKGFWCPEFIGAKARDENAHSFSPAIALFDEDAIEQTKHFSFTAVQQALHETRFKTGGIAECNATLTDLKNQASSIEDARRAEEAAEIAKKEEQEKRKQEHQRKIEAGFFKVDKIFCDKLQKAVDWNYLERSDFRDIMKRTDEWCKNHEGQYVKSSPQQIAKVIVDEIDRIEHNNDSTNDQSKRLWRAPRHSLSDYFR